MSVNLDELGPVDWIVVEFRGSKFTGDIAPILKDYVDRGLIRILDLLFMRKDDDGNLEAFEIADLDDSEIGSCVVTRPTWRFCSASRTSPISQQPSSPAARRPCWCGKTRGPRHSAAVRHAGGHLAASGRIPIQAVIAAIEADAEEGN